MSLVLNIYDFLVQNAAKLSSVWVSPVPGSPPPGVVLSLLQETESAVIAAAEKTAVRNFAVFIIVVLLRGCTFILGGYHLGSLSF